MYYTKLAWRNIWRNKRRTLITAASITLAIFLALVMRSVQVGVYSQIVDNVVQSYTGYIQIHKQGYWDKKEDINNTFSLNDTLIQKISAVSNVQIWVPRLESFALVSKGDQTKGVALTGIDPDKENRFDAVANKIVVGKYLNHGDNGVIVSQGLAGYLNLNVNDTLVMIGQGIEGLSAAGKYPVRGIMHFPSPDLDNRMVYMDLSVCQDFFSCNGRITSLAFNLIDPNKINDTFKEIGQAVNSPRYEVMRWDQMLVDIVEFIKAKNAGSYLIIGILYMIVAFGIFGTVLMMTTERIKEFGVVVSIGMKKVRLAVTVIVEMIYIGILGIIAGILFAVPLIYAYHVHPVRLSGDMAKTMVEFGLEPLLTVAFRSDIFITHTWIILIIVMFAIIYPVQRILKLDVVNALHSK